MLLGSVKQINFVSFNQKNLIFFKTIPSFPSLRALQSIKQCTERREIDGENKHSDNMTNLYNLVEISLFFLLLHESEPGVLLSAVVNKDELM